MITLVLLWHMGYWNAVLHVTGFHSMDECNTMLHRHAVHVAFSGAVIDKAQCVMEKES